MAIDDIKKDDIEKIASVTHEANRAWCIAHGDHSQPCWDDAPGWQKDSAINGVRFHLENTNASPSDSHDNWLKQKQEEGWVYGEEKDAEKKTHPCMVPYDQLPVMQQSKDSLFKGIVHALKKSKSKTFSTDLDIWTMGGWGTVLIGFIDTIKELEEHRPTLSVDERLAVLEDRFMTNDSCRSPANCAAIWFMCSLLHYAFWKCKVLPTEATLDALHKVVCKASDSMRDGEPYIVAS